MFTSMAVGGGRRRFSPRHVTAGTERAPRDSARAAVYKVHILPQHGDTSMPRLTAADFDPEVLKLFDQYVHGGISRRGFLDAAGKYAVGGATAAGLLAALAPDFASARQVDPGDPRLATSKLAFDSPQGYGKASGYL